MTSAIAVPPSSLSVIGDAVSARITRLLDDERERWPALDPILAEPLDVLDATVEAGGKRLRPAFCHWAFVGAGGDPTSDIVVDAGAALELLHTFAIVHDDVMDGSDVRRNQPAVHQAAAARHGVEQWRGEARRFGEGVAILVGDLAYVYADALMAGVTPEARAVYTELRVEVMMGQYLDLRGTAHGAVDAEGALRICRLKSGKYTIERPLHLGAALAGRADLAVGLSAFGLPLGDAFQLRDDILGAFGDAAVTGKPVGEDLREGKPTLLYALAAQCATPAQAAVLDRYGQADLAGDDLATVQSVLHETGAVDELERRIATLAAEADGALDRSGLTPMARDGLRELAAYVVQRDR